ncbi:MAG: hypothetical protein L0H41_03930 [Microlunatus sp.]|nr:hypothetical protein [Microlunatus sp.]MDN5770145.1 hypothetical protein [Microlunatus sp.]
MTDPDPTEAASVGLLLGADVGGTATRVAVATITGQVLAVSTGPAGNPVGVGLAVSAARIRSGVLECLSRVDDRLARVDPTSSSRVRAAVLGLAGGLRIDDTFLRSAMPATVHVQPRLVSDLSVAFSSATAASEGYVLVAGTGAVAGRILDGDLQERRDGWGWLLGDEGSGFWLGREAVRTTVAALQSGLPLGPLGEHVAERMGTRDPVAIIRRCYREPPIWLAAFAELVSRCADDPAAIDIAERAADLLHTTLRRLEPRPELPVVLAGSVVTSEGPVRDALTRLLAGTLANPVITTKSGLVGALWLAGREVGLTEVDLHATLTESCTANQLNTGMKFSVP